MIRWPFVWRRDYDQLKTENHVLREALRDANAEIYRFRILVGSWRWPAKDKAA